MINALAASNPSVRGFLVERIVLAAISVNGLGGVTPNQVEHFDNPILLSQKFKSLTLQNILYVPVLFNYAKLDAVLVSNVFEPAPTAPVSANGIDSVAVRPKSGQKIDKTPQVLKGIHVEFIQVKAGSVTTDSLANTRSLLLKESPEIKFWRGVAGDTGVDVTFSIRWFVPSAEVKQIQSSKAGILKGEKIAEKVNPLSSMHKQLDL